MKSSAGLLKVRLAPSDSFSENEFHLAQTWHRHNHPNSAEPMLQVIVEARKYSLQCRYAYYTLFAYDPLNKIDAKNSAVSIRVPSQVAPNER